MCDSPQPKTPPIEKSNDAMPTIMKGLTDLAAGIAEDQPKANLEPSDPDESN